MNSANYAGPGNLTKKIWLSYLEKCKETKNRTAFFICTLIAIRSPIDPAPIVVEEEDGMGTSPGNRKATKASV